MDKQDHINISFELFFDEYYAAAVRYCFTIVMDRHEAEDIVQQVFVSMWQSQREGIVYSASRSYLYRSVYNASLSFLKHERVKQVHVREMRTTQPAHIDPRDSEGTGLQIL